MVSLALQWGDFVTIYDATNHAPLVLFFLCVQAIFLLCMSPCRGVLSRVLCCRMCKSSKSEGGGAGGKARATPQGNSVELVYRPAPGAGTGVV